MVYLRRITTGIVAHFPERFSEWGMALGSFGMGLVLIVQPNMFELSPSFEVLKRSAGEASWAVAFLACTVIRIIALIINGSFEWFRYSPILRGIASIAGAFFWSRFCLGIILSTAYHDAPLSGVVMYGLATFFELANLSRSALDFARQRK